MTRGPANSYTKLIQPRVLRCQVQLGNLEEAKKDLSLLSLERRTFTPGDVDGSKASSSQQLRMCPRTSTVATPMHRNQRINHRKGVGLHANGQDLKQVLRVSACSFCCSGRSLHQGQPLLTWTQPSVLVLNETTKLRQRNACAPAWYWLTWMMPHYSENGIQLQA